MQNIFRSGLPKSACILFNNTVLGVVVSYFSHESHFHKAVKLIKEDLKYTCQFFSSDM